MIEEKDYKYILPGEKLECAYKLLEDYVRNNWEKY